MTTDPEREPILDNILALMRPIESPDGACSSVMMGRETDQVRLGGGEGVLEGLEGGLLFCQRAGDAVASGTGGRGTDAAARHRGET